MQRRGIDGLMGEATSGACAAPDQPHSLPYNAGFDGIRGLAIAGVMASHYGNAFFNHGGNGVDLFFVLSGFLITGVLLAAFPGQTLGEFYWNRFFRLAPALVFVCIVYAAVGFFFSDIKQAAEDIAASLTNVANWTRAYDLGTPRYLAQAWSLSLEEQFYIVYPPVLLLLASRMARKTLALVLSTLCLCVIAHRLSLGASGATTDRIYNGLDTHSDGLALGAALAVAISRHRLNRLTAAMARCDVVALCGVLLLFAAVSWPHAVVFTDIAAAWLIFGASYPGASSAAAILSAKPLVLLGRVSYSLYLWHYPVQQYLANKSLLSWWEIALVGIPLSLVLATISFCLIERPILHWRRSVAKPVRAHVGAFGAMATASVMIGALAYFIGPLVVQSLHPAAFAVVDYRPDKSVVGKGFNTQAGGVSVVWVNTTARPPEDLTASWQGKRLPVYSLARRIAVFVPPDFVDTVGSKTIEITTMAETTLLGIDIVALPERSRLAGSTVGVRARETAVPR